MRVAYVDNTMKDGEHFKKMTEEISQIKSCEIFDRCDVLFDYLNNNKVNIIFVHIEINYNNIEKLFKKIKDFDNDIEIVFITEHKDCSVRAFEMDVLSYIVKPFNIDCIKKIIAKTMKLHLGEKAVPFIRTFGNFDLFINGKAVMFSNKKSKEMLALLVDKCGGNLNMEQIIDVLWEDRPFDENTKALYRIALKNLRDTLIKEKCADILIETRGQRAIDVKKVDCDYYNLINGKNTDVIFAGEYMTNYSWGEYTLARLYDKFC